MKIQFRNEHICIFESALYRTTTTVLNFKNLVLLVDPNWLPIEIETIQKYVESIRKDKPLWLLFTHADYDHIIASGAFKADRIIASQKFKEDTDREKALKEIQKFDEEHYIKRSYPIVYPEADYVVTSNGQELNHGELSFKFYLAPGHTADGLFTLIHPFGIWIAGDYLSNVEFPFIYDNHKAYLETMNKAQELVKESSILITGHGDYTQDQEEMKKRILVSKNYIEGIKKALKAGKDYGIEKLLKQYDFPQGLRISHENNIALIAKNLD